jgi:hypothetical protein
LESLSTQVTPLAVIKNPVLEKPRVPFELLLKNIKTI